MNSLTYLSRQFDVLAAARTPPSTPTLQNASLFADGNQEASTSLKRVQTWSQRSFVPTSGSGGASPAPWLLRRSYSSPAEVNPAESPSAPTTLPRTSSTPSGSRPSSRRPSISSQEKAVRTNRVESLFYRIFFVRVLLSLWNYLLGMWRSMTAKAVPKTSRQVVAEEASDEEEKDIEGEGKDEKPPIPMHPATPVPPPLPLPVTIPHLSRTNTDPGVVFLDSKTPVETGPSTAVASARVAEPPRAATPPRKVPLLHPKTLVLDLDETLIHSTSRPMENGASGSSILSSLGFGRRNKGGHTVEVMLGGRSTLYHVYKRPFVDYFLRKVSTWYTLVIFTASMQEYADPVIDWLDAGRGILVHRLFRESCTQLPNGNYTKDLSIIEKDLSRVCLVDNSPICYSMNEANGIPIEGWINDPHDEALLDLLPVLDSLRFTKDVRRVLGIRGFGHIS